MGYWVAAVWVAVAAVGGTAVGHWYPDVMAASFAAAGDCACAGRFSRLVIYCGDQCGTFGALGGAGSGELQEMEENGRRIAEMSCLRKEKMIIALMGTALLLLTSCRNEIQTDIPSTESPAGVQEVSTTQEEEAYSFSFDDLKTVQFRFSSGAGAWATILNIREDGSFHGWYQDSNSEIGEGYPNGSCYQCDFSGQFTEPMKVNDYT